VNARELARAELLAARVPCSMCEARAGKPCVTKHGARAAAPHRARVRAGARLPETFFVRRLLRSSIE
jgi:hypothetical protein